MRVTGMGGGCCSYISPIDKVSGNFFFFSSHPDHSKHCTLQVSVLTHKHKKCKVSAFCELSHNHR